MTDNDPTAEFLLTNRFNQILVDNIPDALYPDSTEAAYMVQDHVVSKLTEKYRSAVCGYKLACTNTLAMELLGVDGPFSGRMLSHSTHQSGTELTISDFVHRVIETEFVFVLSQDVPNSERSYTANTIKPFIGAFMPAIEIVDHRYRDFTRVGGGALIADNAIHGASVLGDPDKQWQAIDLSSHPASLVVNGEIHFRGRGENVLGSPLNAMAWLANHLQSRGSSLKTGDIVTTGTACDVYNARAGDHILADFGELGTVSFSFG